MNRDPILETINTITAKMSFSYIQGIAEEITEILFRLQMKDEKKVKDFALFFDYETNHYRVVVVLKDYTFSVAQSIFLSFFEFISYAGANITVSQKTKQGMHYTLASFDERGEGFSCEIDFLPEGASAEDGEQQRQEETSARTGAVSSGQRKQPEVRWKFELDSASYLPLLTAQDLIYSVGEEGDLYAVDTRMGMLRWHWRAERQYSKIATVPSVDQNVLAVYTLARSQPGIHEATLSVLDVQTGLLLRAFPVPALQSIGQCHLLTIQNGIAYLSGTDRNLLLSGPQSLCLAFDLQTGTQKWRVDLGRYMGTTTPVVSDTQVYLATFDIQSGHPTRGHLHALDIRTGSEIWNHQFETRGIQEIVVDGTEIFVAGTPTEVVDALTGRTKWSLPDLKVFRDSPLVVSDEVIYINYEHISEGRGEFSAKKPHEVLLTGGPLRAGAIVAIERASRQPRWIIDLTYGRSFPTKPVLANSAVYTTWKHLDIRGEVINATLLALDAHTGQELWQFEADDLSAPRGGDGVVFVRGQEDQKEYIYALS